MFFYLSKTSYYYIIVKCKNMFVSTQDICQYSQVIATLFTIETFLKYPSYMKSCIVQFANKNATLTRRMIMYNIYIG